MSEFRQIQRYSTILAASAAMLWPIQAHAQAAPADSAASDDGQAIGDIIVTAERRAARLIDVPIPISAITAKDIAARDVASLSDMQNAIPGLRIVEIGVGFQRIQLRGISNFAGLPTVGNYIDEFPINNYGASGTADISLLDMERVEVLRGPQPTLYGEGSMGGTIRYVTAKPDLSRASGHFEAEVNSVKGGDIGFRAQAVANVPLSDKAGLRIAADHRQDGGWIDGPLRDKANVAHYNTIRGTLLLRPSEQVEITAMILHNQEDQDTLGYSDSDHVTFGNILTPSRQSYTIGTLNASYDAGPVTILNAFGYMDQKGRATSDSGPFYNDFVFLAPLIKDAPDTARSRLKKINEELRITSNGAGPLRYMIGALYTHGTTTGSDIGYAEAYPAYADLLAGTLPFFAFNINTDSKSAVWAVYGNVSYDIGPFKVEAGGRYFHDRQSAAGGYSGKFHSFNPRVSVSLKTSDSGTIYVDAAKGFRSGGFNANATAGSGVPPTYGPERLWSYEIGTKQELFDHRLLIEADFYYNDYKGVQINTPIPPLGLVGTLNAGAAAGPGVDVTMTGRITPDLSVSGSIGYNHIRYTKASGTKNDGERLDLVADWTGSLAVDYTPRLSEDYGLIAHVDYNYSDKAAISVHSASLDQTGFTQPRSLVNARLGVTRDKLSVYVFAKNIANTTKIVNPRFGGYFQPVYTKPRVIGVGLSADF